MRRFDFAPRVVATFAIAALLLALGSALAPAGAARADEAAEPDPPKPVRRTGEVSITASRVERPVLDVPGNVTVIDREAIERSGARSVPELLRREAGLFVTNDIGSPEGYRVEGRGFHNGGGNGSSLLVLMDGRRLNEADSSFIDWSMVHLDRVERIEILRGPASALYGDAANAGVVQIVTRRGAGPPTVTARGSRASYDTSGGSFYAGGSRGPLSATFFVEGEDGDGYRQRSGYEGWTAVGTVRATPTDTLALELAAGHQDDERLRPGALTRREMRVLGRDAAAPDQEDDRDDVHNTWVQGLAEAVVSEHVTLKLVPYWRGRDDRARVATPATGGTAFFATDQEARSWGGSVQAEIRAPIAGLASRFLVGGELLRDHVERFQRFDSPDGASVTDARLERTIWSAFVQEELSLTDTLLLSAGLRFDVADYDGEIETEGAFGGFPFTDRLSLDESPDRWSPRVALTWRARPDTSLYASWARGFRFPNLDEAVGFTGALFDLSPQDSDTYEIGVKHRGERLSANLALYWMEVEDEILFNHEIDAFGFPSPQNVNIDRTRHRGAEIWFSWRPWEWLELYGAYTYDDATIEHDSTATLADLDGNRLPITPRHHGSAGTIVAVPLPWDRLGLELGAHVNVVGKRYVANDLLNEYAKLDDYTTLDLHSTLRVRPSERLELALTTRVRNALNQHYSEFAGERTFVRGEIGYNPAPDTNYELVLAVTWRP